MVARTKGERPNSRVFRQKKSGPQNGRSTFRLRISHKLLRMLCSYIALVYWWKGKVGVYIAYNGMKYKFHVIVNIQCTFISSVNGTHIYMCIIHYMFCFMCYNRTCWDMFIQIHIAGVVEQSK